MIDSSNWRFWAEIQSVGDLLLACKLAPFFDLEVLSGASQLGFDLVPPHFSYFLPDLVVAFLQRPPHDSWTSNWCFSFDRISRRPRRLHLSALFVLFVLFFRRNRLLFGQQTQQGMVSGSLARIVSSRAGNLNHLPFCMGKIVVFVRFCQSASLLEWFF